MAAKTAQTADVEEIGLLLVHGIGEQKRLEHLRCTAAEVASAVSNRHDVVRFSLIDQTGDAFPEIIIEASFAEGRQVRLHLHEVWWADLGSGAGFMDQTRFWSWGLGQWADETIVGLEPRRNTKMLMALPHVRRGRKPMDRPRLHRRLGACVGLFLAGWLALLTMITWSLAKRLVALISNTLPDSALIVLFLGDVRTYVARGDPGQGTLEDPDLPVRTTIRRRMVSAMVKVATRPYDRWYVLAHSLGSVLAFNGLQETEIALPNYLTPEEWDAVPGRLRTSDPFTPPGVELNLDDMMPRRPPWLEDTDAISRVQLFVGLQGLVTYGSPLDKFAALWPKIVCLNQQSAVFPENCEWLNLYDATDPVSGNLDAFTAPQPHRDAGGRIAINPENACCRASPIFLLSHLRYLTPRRRNTHSVPSELFDAIIDGTALQAAVERSEVDAVHRRLRGIGALVQVLIVTALLTVAAAILVGLLFNLVGLKDHACPKAANLLQPACQSLLTTHALFVLGVTWVAVVAVGLVRLILSALARRHQKAASKARQPERAQPA